MPLLSAVDPFWVLPRQTECHEMEILPAPLPHVVGRSKRLYVKGDGEILSVAPSSTNSNVGWEYATRSVTIGFPYRELGDINDYWNVGQYINLLAKRETARCIDESSAASWHNMTFYSSVSTGMWEKGRSLTDYVSELAPHGLHFQDFADIGYEGVHMFWESLGSYTLAVPNQFNEWVVIFAELYPCHVEYTRYISVYYLRIRNYWVAEKKFLGAYSVGYSPAEEGWAVCKSSEGFWLHIGYLDRVIGKYNFDGELMYFSQVDFSFNSIYETKTQAGLWAIRNDQIYWYEDTGSELIEQFTITNSKFIFLQTGGTDAEDNLWLLDRDSSTVYRVNFASRIIDYDSSFSFVAGVWPHPHDRSVFLYTSFNADTFSTSIDRVWLDDPYGYRDLVCHLPEVPLSDLTGVQFMGKVGSSYITPSQEDPNWGNHSHGIEWQTMSNASLGLSDGKYKQFKFNLNRISEDNGSVRLNKIRIPKPLILSNVPYGFGREVHINSHLRYLAETVNENLDLVAWWKVNA
jgi:hypothetical protein